MLSRETSNNKSLTYEYIRGLVEGEGCFTFCTRTNTPGVKERVPAFSVAMHERDTDLLIQIRDFLHLKNTVYNFKNHQNDGCKRGRRAVLIVREFGSLKNVIIPLFYGKLHGYKGKQFFDWLEKIGEDPLVPKSFKLLHRLHKCGFYRNNPAFND